MGIVLALASALSYGISDVLGGVASRRISFVHVALIGQAGALAVVALTMVVTSVPPAQGASLAWGAASGVGTGMAMTFLFRGISRGAMSVVVPVSAVGGVALPVLVAVVLLGEKPSMLTWAGILLALPSLWLISRSPDRPGTPSRSSVADGLVASVGIALQYLCLAQAGSASGLWPILSGRGAALATILLALVLIARRGARASDTGQRRPTLSMLTLSAAAGVLAAAALTLYLAALRTELVTVTVVLSSLYPVVPVLVGLMLLREQLRRSQGAGVALVMVATVLIAVG